MDRKRSLVDATPHPFEGAWLYACFAEENDPVEVWRLVVYDVISLGWPGRWGLSASGSGVFATRWGATKGGVGRSRCALGVGGPRGGSGLGLEEVSGGADGLRWGERCEGGGCYGR